MGSPYKHFSPTKLKKLSKEQMSALRKELQLHIKEDPMMRALISSHRKMTKLLKEKVRKKFPTLR
jgi:hypothetical protein